MKIVLKTVTVLKISIPYRRLVGWSIELPRFARILFGNVATVIDESDVGRALVIIFLVIVVVVGVIVFVIEVRGDDGDDCSAESEDGEEEPRLPISVRRKRQNRKAVPPDFRRRRHPTNGRGVRPEGKIADRQRPNKNRILDSRRRTVTLNLACDRGRGREK